MNPDTATLAELFAASTTAQSVWNQDVCDGMAKGWTRSTAEAYATARLRDRARGNPTLDPPRAWRTSRRSA